MKTKLIRIAKGDKVEITVRRPKDKTGIHLDACVIGPVTVSLIVSKCR
jgi:hypothetical protein